MAEQKVVTAFEIELAGFNAKIKEAADGMASFDKEAEEAKDSTKELSGASGSAVTKVKQLGTVSQTTAKDIKAAAKETGGFKDLLSGAKAELNSAFPVLGKVGNAAKLLGRAFTVALGPVGIVIAAVVAGLGLLVKAFFGTQEGADKLAKVTAVVSAVFDRLLGIAQTLGKRIFDTFSNPKKAVEDLWEALKTNIVNRITGLADQFKFLGEIIAGVFTLDTDRITAGVEGFGEATVRTLTGVEDLAGKVANGFNELGKEIDAAAKTGARIAEIDKQLRALALNRAQNEGRISRELEEQRAIVSNVAASAAERNAAAQKFNALQKQLTGFEQRRLDLEIERGKLATSLSDTSDEEKIQLAELVSAKEEALARELAANREINNQINGLNKAAADKQAAEDERQRQAREQAEQEAAAKRAELAAEQLTLQQGVNDRLDELQQQRELSQLSAGDRAIEEARIRAAKEIEVAAVAYDRLEELAQGNADRIAEIRAQEAESTRLIEQALVDQITAIRSEGAAEQAEKLKEEQEQRIEVLTAASDQLNGVIEGAAAGQIKSAEEAGKAIIGIALEILEKQALLAITNATIGSLATPQSVATGGTLGIAQAAILTALIKAALAGVRGALAGSFYEGGIVGKDGGMRMHGGRDGYLARVHKGEHIMPTVETNKYMPYLEMMRGGKFEEWVAGMQNATTQGGYKDIKVPGFNDRKLVGAMGSVGSLSEQRKQTELLASLNRRMGRRMNKRYVA